VINACNNASGLGGQPAMARVKAALGDVDGAFTALGYAVKLHDPFFVSEPLSSPPFGRLRSDPRFGELMRQVGLVTPPVAPAADQRPHYSEITEIAD